MEEFKVGDIIHMKSGNPVVDEYLYKVTSLNPLCGISLSNCDSVDGPLSSRMTWVKQGELPQEGPIETATFRDSSKKFTFVVKKEFIEKYPDAEAKTVKELLTKCYLIKYVHNEDGPAIIKHGVKDILDYWIDGVRLEKEDFDFQTGMKYLQNGMMKGEL